MIKKCLLRALNGSIGNNAGGAVFLIYVVTALSGLVLAVFILIDKPFQEVFELTAILMCISAVFLVIGYIFGTD
jgi:hypothetical protein